jgi:hypothetical protein
MAPAAWSQSPMVSASSCLFFVLSSDFLLTLQCAGTITASCPASECITSGSYFGCENYNADTFVTECLDSTDPICQTFATQTDATWDYATWCCLQDSWPYCATILKAVDGDVLTQFECFSALSGEVTAVDAPSSASSSTTESSSGSQTTATDPAETSADDGGDGGGSGRSTNHTGAIVGGVVGGVALIGLLGFGFWFVRYQKRKNAAKTSAPSSGGSPSTYQSPGVYHAQGYSQAAQMSPQMQQQQVPPFQANNMPYYAQSPSQHSEYPNSAYPGYPNNSPGPMMNPHAQPHHPHPQGAVEAPTDNQKNPVELG